MCPPIFIPVDTVMAAHRHNAVPGRGLTAVFSEQTTGSIKLRVPESAFVSFFTSTFFGSSSLQASLSLSW